MARCPDCNKFVSFDTDSDPETNLDVSTDGCIGGDVRIVNTCADCGTDLRSASFDVDVQPDQITSTSDEVNPPGGKTLADHLEAHAEARRLFDEQHRDDGTEPDEGSLADEPELSLEETNSERTERTEGKGRGARKFYGARVEVEITCSCGWVGHGEWSEDTQASNMDEEG